MPLKDAQITLLTQLVLNALKEAKAESEKVRQYLPDFFERLREDLVNEMRGERESRQAIKTIHYIKYQMRLAHRLEVLVCLPPIE